MTTLIPVMGLRRALAARAHVCVVCALCVATNGYSGPAHSDATERVLRPGLTRNAAIEVCGFMGELNYLDTLVCDDGTKPPFKPTAREIFRNEGSPDAEARAGDTAADANTAPAPPVARHRIHEWNMLCKWKTIALYLDPNHCPDSRLHPTPPGFHLVPKGP